MDIDEVVPREALAGFLDEHVAEGRGEPPQVTHLGDGKSNLTFRVQRGDRAWVLRRPPLGDIPETAHDMLREYRVLSALTDTPVRAPRPVVACDDTDVLGVPFYLMEPVEGAVIRADVPEGYGDADRLRIGYELVDALAELHAVDFEAIGLADLGRPAGYTARQVQRWAKQWEVMATRELADIEAVRDWLGAHVPEQTRHAIVHGDYKLDNVVMSTTSPARLVAILDWEMATLGDPLADLGYLMVFWPEPREPQVVLPQPSAQPGFATRAELIARYEEAAGFAVTDLDLYRTLALWKLAILCEGLYKRYLAGKARGDWYALLEEAVPTMARQAREWCDA